MKQTKGLKVEQVKTGQLNLHPHNARQGDVGAICQSLEAHGQYRPLVVQRSTGYVLAGNHTLQAAQALGWTEVDVTYLDVDDDQALRILLVDNRSNDLATYDNSVLTDLLESLVRSDFGLEGTGFDGSDLDDLLAEFQADPPYVSEGNASLADRFIVPPFTVLDARSGPWQERKRSWLAHGIQSEVGREDNVTLGSLSGRVPDYYDQKNRAEQLAGHALSTSEFETHHLVVPQGSSINATGTSVFDPVLVELANRWYCRPGGKILDPFAGGSVRGAVSALLGRRYTGVDLRTEQIEANKQQWEQIATRNADAPAPEWIAGDSLDVIPTLGCEYDLLFSCPPYADLERYSDNPADLSTMDYDNFLSIYRSIIASSVDKLGPDAFCVWVVGEVRDRKGNYRGFVPDTIKAFKDAGASFYNEAILVTPTGALAITSGRTFAAGRKLGKNHQNVLVFAKGNAKHAAQLCGDVDVSGGLAAVESID